MRLEQRDWLEKGIGLLMLAGAVTLISVGLLARGHFRHVVETAALPYQSRTTIQTIEGVTRGLVDAETGQRGFLLTGDSRYLAPYYSGIDEARSRLGDASFRIKGDFKAVALGEKLGHLAEAKLEELALSVALMHLHGQPAALAVVQQEESQRIMTDIRKISAALVTREQSLLTERTSTAEAAVDATERLFWELSGVLALFFIAGAVYLPREVRMRAAASHALRDSEKQLMQSERFIKGMADTLPVLIGYVDRTETYRFANHQYAQHFGAAAAPFEGKTMMDLLGEEYEDVRSEVAGVLQGIPQNFERMTVASNRNVHVIVNYAPDIDATGAVVGFYIMVTDITARKAAELAVANQEQMLRTITDNVPALICYIDRSHHFRFNNRAYERWLQKPLTEITGRHLGEIYGEDVYRRLAPELDRAMAGERSNFDIAFTGHDRQPHFARGKYVPHHEGDGKVVGIYGLITDETKLRRAEHELRVSQRFVERAGEVAGVGGWQMDLVTQLIHWSNETCRMHDVEAGYRPALDEAIGFYAPEARDAIAEAVRLGIESGTPWDLELPLISARGRPFWARAVGEAEYADGKIVRLIGAFQDITRRKAAEQALTDSRKILQVTLESIGDAVITTDNEGLIQWLNPVAERLTGWFKAEAVGKPLAQVFMVLDEETRVPVDDPIRRCLVEGKVTGIAHKGVLVSRDGSEYGIEDSTSPIRDALGEGHGAVLVFHDVSETRRLNKEMSHRASHDPLTGLANRSEFETRLARMMAGLSREDTVNSLLYVDLDQFKLVNDACGHSVGDQLLKQVSALLSHCVRGRDTVARLGGDEFGVILERCEIEQAQKVAQKICDQMEEFRFLHDGRRFRVGASIGLVPVDRRWTNMAAVLQAADASCYAAKEAGRNRVHVWFDTDRMVKTRQGEMQWASRLEQALDENRFELYGQRIQRIDETEGGLHCEVLLRLREIDGSIILPGVFLPAAERFNMATRIDRWVLHQVLGWMRESERAGVEIEMVAVNLSGHSVGDRTFHRDVRELIHGAGVDMHRLCIEITETAAITNFRDAKSFIDEIRELGVKVSLDDFGAGASSFGYLKSLPVDFLKIDGQFIKDVLSDPLDNAAVRCFREVAAVVGVKTIAECVETEEIRSALRVIGIDFIQGYLIHRPEPLEHLIAVSA